MFKEYFDLLGIPDKTVEECCEDLNSAGYEITPQELEAVMEMIDLDPSEIH